MAKQLTITLNGKTYTAPKPKVKLWRQIAKFKDQNNGKDLNEVLDGVLELICMTFNNQEITPDVLEEDFELEQLMTTFQSVVEYVNSIVYGKSKQLPNATTPTTN